jgi:hypothetical protein
VELVGIIWVGSFRDGSANTGMPFIVVCGSIPEFAYKLIDSFEVGGV